jgi:hypothetical protein
MARISDPSRRAASANRVSSSRRVAAAVTLAAPNSGRGHRHDEEVLARL